MRRHQPLTVRQLEVLQWVADDCPAGLWRDFTYKTTAYALAARGLLSVQRRRHQWSATLTDDGRFYLQHGRYPSDPTPAGQPSASQTVSGADDFAAQLLAELTSGAGQVIVRSPSDRERARYRRAIHLLITGHCLPARFVLRHTGRDHGDLTIRLSPRDADPRPTPPPQVSVPTSTAAVSPEVRALTSRVRLAVTEPTRERAARILQAIAEQCAARGWSLDREPTDDRWLQIATRECSFELTLREELVARDVPDDDKLRTAKYNWQRIPLQPSKVGSGRLTLQLGRYYPTRSWSDRRRWTLDDKLGAMFAELDARVAEATEQRRRRETELLARQHAWDAAVAAARQAYVVEFNRRRLHEQADHHAQAAKLRDYAHTLQDVAGGCADAAASESIRSWQRWARDEADRIDPLGHLHALRYLEPDAVTSDDYAPFMRAGMNPHQRPTR